MSNKPLDLTRTKAALKIFNDGEARRNVEWQNAKTSKAILICVEKENTAMRLVKEAFADDTADRNSRDSALLVDMVFIRQLVAKYS